MLERKKIFLICLAITAISFFSEISSAKVEMASISEILSLNTGSGSVSVLNQFGGVTKDPYNGFAVDSAGNVLISDTLNSRVMRFNRQGVTLAPFTYNDSHSFFPQNICFVNGDLLVVQNTRPREINVFSANGTVLRTLNSASLLDSNSDDTIRILSLACFKSNIQVAFLAYKRNGKPIGPVYLDDYDKSFKLTRRRVFQNAKEYYRTVREIDTKFEKHFEDDYGNSYGYPIVEDWYGKFLPLLKYSPESVLMRRIDGQFLSKHTKYLVHDYYELEKMSYEWREMRGRNFLIVNWYVSPSGVIYVLLANNDCIKVLEVKGI